MNPKKGICDTKGAASGHSVQPSGPYELIRRLRGSQNWTTYLAKDSEGNNRSLKFVDIEKLTERHRVLDLQKGTPPEEAIRKAREYAQSYKKLILESVDRVRGLGNDHVAATLGTTFDEDRGQLVIVSEYTPGVDLAYMAERLNPLQLVFLFTQVLDGLDFIHKNGFLHLNIKPSRIWVDIEQESPSACFTDFGFGVPIGKYDGECAGTLLYMAPEVVLDSKEPIDERADLYSFGVTMYACLTGRIPLEKRLDAQSDEASVKTPPSFYNNRVPKEMDEIVLGLLEKEPDDRKFKHADALLKVFHNKWPDECNSMPHEGTCELSSRD